MHFESWSPLKTCRSSARLWTGGVALAAHGTAPSGVKELFSSVPQTLFIWCWYLTLLLSHTLSSHWKQDLKLSVPQLRGWPLQKQQVLFTHKMAFPNVAKWRTWAKNPPQFLERPQGADPKSQRIYFKPFLKCRSLQQRQRYLNPNLYFYILSSSRRLLCCVLFTFLLFLPFTLLLRLFFIMLFVYF